MGRKPKQENDIIVFEKEYQGRAGRPRNFKNEDEFKDTAWKYFTLCDKHKRMPNKAGFCAYANISRETFYNQKEFYPEVYDVVEMLLEDGVLNTPINPSLAALNLTNYFNYSRNEKEDNDSYLKELDKLSDAEVERILKKLK